jgi:hypothetical protein
MEKLDMRSVKVKGVIYFRAEDIGKYLRSLGDTEPTDTQARLDEAAQTFEDIAEKESQ